MTSVVSVASALILLGCAVAAYAQTCASSTATPKQYSIALFVNQVNTSYNAKQTFFAARLAVAQINAQNMLGSNDTIAISNGGQPFDLGVDVRSQFCFTLLSLPLSCLLVAS